MKRRAFLGFLGGAAASGPALAKSAASASLADLSIPNALSGGVGFVSNATASMMDDTGWAKDRLTHILGKTATQIAFERRRHHIGALDPNIGALRSVSLQSKIEWSRSLSYDRNAREEKSYFQAVVEGWLK